MTPSSCLNFGFLSTPETRTQLTSQTFRFLVEIAILFPRNKGNPSNDLATSNSFKSSWGQEDSHLTSSHSSQTSLTKDGIFPPTYIFYPHLRCSQLIKKTEMMMTPSEFSTYALRQAKRTANETMAIYNNNQNKNRTKRKKY